MKTLQVRLPDHINEKVKHLAKDEGISMKLSGRKQETFLRKLHPALIPRCLRKL